MFTFSTPLWQTVAAAAVLVATGLAAWLAPPVIEFVFGRLLGVYVVYHPPPPEDEDDPAVAHAAQLTRYHYAHFSRWRTDFWLALTIALVLFIVITGLIVSYWMVHKDFLSLLVWSLGIGTVIALVGLGQFFSNAFAYLFMVFTGGPVRVSDYVEVGGAHGEIVAIRPLYTELRGYYPLTGASAPVLVGSTSGGSVASTVQLFQAAQTEMLRPLGDAPARPDRAAPIAVRAQTARQQHIPNTWLLFQCVRVHPARLHAHCPTVPPPDPPGAHAHSEAPSRPTSFQRRRRRRDATQLPHPHSLPPANYTGGLPPANYTGGRFERDGPSVRGDYPTYPDEDEVHEHVVAHGLWNSSDFATGGGENVGM